MKKYPKVSIIIPLYKITPYFYQAVEECLKLDYPDFEVLIVVDRKTKYSNPNKKIRVLKTKKGRTGPAEKRDLAIKYAKGEVCAFIDDDAYPDHGWLKNAAVHFQEKAIAAVGGPGLTPPEDGFWAQITGVVYKSYFCGGRTQHRFVKAEKRFVSDYPAYNLLIRKDVLEEVGGYGSYFYGGEDTFLCLKVIKKRWKILYDPEVVVYHHRRPLFIPYLAQIANVGTHRGYFAKKFPETSQQLVYFYPSILTLGFLTLLFASIFSSQVRILFLSLIGLFYAIAALSVAKKATVLQALLTGLGVILTHLTYGAFFVKGLLTRKLTR